MTDLDGEELEKPKPRKAAAAKPKKGSLKNLMTEFLTLPLDVIDDVTPIPLWPRDIPILTSLSTLKSRCSDGSSLLTSFALQGVRKRFEVI